MQVIDQAEGRGWVSFNGDSADVLRGLPDASAHMALFSPPFEQLYTYSPSERDLGNCRTPEEFWRHFGFITHELVRVMMPGRKVCVHVAQIPSLKGRDGVIGLKDFRGSTITHFQSQGFVYDGEVCVDKDPQAQAIRTKSKALLFAQLHRDSSWSRPALADYVLLFRTPGENPVPILPAITNEDWIAWARPVWYGIDETDTLNAAAGRERDDERHICPLQLPLIERCVQLWSNPGEVVLSPFAGIASEGVGALRHGRKAILSELKPSYWRAGVRNLRAAEHGGRGSADLFTAAGIEVAG